MKKRFMLMFVSFGLLLSGCATTNIHTTSAAIQTKVDAAVTADIEIGERIKGSASNAGFSFKRSYADGISYQVGEIANLPDASESESDLPFILKLYVWPIFIVDAVNKASNKNLSVEKVKAQAAYNAIKLSDADIIVAPRYFITTKSRFLRTPLVTVDVEGYKGTYKSIK